MERFVHIIHPFRYYKEYLLEHEDWLPEVVYTWNAQLPADPDATFTEFMKGMRLPTALELRFDCRAMEAWHHLRHVEDTLQHYRKALELAEKQDATVIIERAPPYNKFILPELALMKDSGAIITPMPVSARPIGLEGLFSPTTLLFTAGDTIDDAAAAFTAARKYGVVQGGVLPLFCKDKTENRCIEVREALEEYHHRTQSTVYCAGCQFTSGTSYD